MFTVARLLNKSVIYDPNTFHIKSYFVTSPFGGFILKVEVVTDIKGKDIPIALLDVHG